MDNAAADTVLFQQGEQVVGRAQIMQNHRPVELAGDCQLLRQQIALFCAVFFRAAAVIIQPDFAYPHFGLALQLPA